MYIRSGTTDRAKQAMPGWLDEATTAASEAAGIPLRGGKEGSALDVRRKKKFVRLREAVQAKHCT